MSGDANRGLEDNAGLTDDELAQEGVTALPDKEVVSILDLNADLNLALDLAAPIDLAIGANANVAAPIDASVGANILSAGSTAQALGDQSAMITQHVVGDANATAHQMSGIDSSGDGATTDAAAPADATTGDPTGDLGGTVGDATGGVGGAAGGATGDVGGVVSGATGGVGDTVSGIDTSDALGGNVLNVNVNLDANADLTAPIAGAVAANANVAAPIDAAASANIGSVASSATAIANQDAVIDQSIDGDASAVADQGSDITQ
ncbi:MAG: peptidoglycan-binding protein [Chloroflexota bacterium]